MQKRAFDHILVIMFENQYRGYVMENEYMRNLAAQGIELSNSFGVMHPSQTNYIASISGELCQVTDDAIPNPLLSQNTIVDLIEASPHDIDWRAYMDSYVPENIPWTPTDFAPQDHFPYVIKHNPFSSYKNITENEERWKKIDNEAGFYRDLLNDDFPAYAWFTPNMWNDGHYINGTQIDTKDGDRAPVLVDQQAVWLESFLDGLNFPGPNSKLPPNTLVVVTYDEADFEKYFDQNKKYYYDGPNQIYTVLLGDMISPAVETEGYNHYSLLKTVEKNFNLNSLNKNDKDANWFQFLWDKKFQWKDINKTPVSNSNSIEAIGFKDQLFLFSLHEFNHLSYRTTNGNQWSEPNNLLSDCTSSYTLTSVGDLLLLAYVNKQDALKLLQYDYTNGWAPALIPECGNIVQVQIIAATNAQSLVMVYQDSQGTLFSLHYINGKWQQTPEQLCAQCNGSFTLAAIGASILLIYKTAGSNNLACLTYNTESFNQINLDETQPTNKQNDTTINQWSPNPFMVNHFSETANPLHPEEPDPSTQGYNALGILSAATLDGVVHLTHNIPESNQLFSETFSIHGILTSKLPVSYDPSKMKTTSNGYGTMFEAGWSLRAPVGNVLRDANGPISMAHFNDEIWLFFETNDQHEVFVCKGGYVS